MSNKPFPTLRGVTWDIQRTPRFKTETQESVSGLETRAQLMVFPLDEWEMVFDLLPEATDFAELIGFFKARGGKFDSFLLTIPSDSSIAQQELGVGDGIKTDFPLLRTIGGYSEPVENGVVTAVEVGDVPLIGGQWSVTSTLAGFASNLHLETAPAIDAAVIADFTYSWRVRFQDDAAAFNNFMHRLWEAKSILLKQVRGAYTDVNVTPVLPVGHVVRGAGLSVGFGTAGGAGGQTGQIVGRATGIGAATGHGKTTQNRSAGTAVGTGTARGVGSTAFSFSTRQYLVPGVGRINVTGERQFRLYDGSGFEQLPPTADHAAGRATGTGTAVGHGLTFATAGKGVATGTGTATGGGKVTVPFKGTATGTGTARGASPVAPPPQTSSTVPTRTVIDTVGVNTHIDFNNFGYQNLTTTINAINYMGLKHIRDCPGNDNDLSGARSWLTVANATGAKFLAFIGENSVNSAIAQRTRFSTLFAQGILYGVEGCNEWDTAQKQIPSAGVDLTQAAQFQPSIYQVGQVQFVPHTPAVNMSFGQGWTATNNWIGNYATQGDLSAVCTHANAHTYPTTTQGQYWSMDRLNTLAHLAAASRPVIHTEFGWNESQGFSLAVNARSALQVVFDAIVLKVVKVYFYALFNDGSGLFGLMNQDGSPKPAGTAIRNLMAILADPGGLPNRQDVLNYTTTGTTANDLIVVMQKSTGVFQIALWNELDTAHNVVVHLSSASPAKIYDPASSAAAATTLSSTTSITINVSGVLQILELS